MSFPKHFLWGTSVSAAQYEGAWNEGGKSPVLLDYATSGSPQKSYRTLHYLDENGNCQEKDFMITCHIPKGAKLVTFDDLHYTNHRAGDFYHRYKEDIALMKEMGFTTFNTSISWARIYPNGSEGGLNQEGVAFYRDVFTECRNAGIDPVITLYKYDEPIYFDLKYGGWSNRKMIDEFVLFATTCFKEYKDLVNKWITFNELNMLQASTINSVAGSDPSMNQERYEEVHNQMVAAARAVKKAHEINPDNQVGCVVCGVCIYPLTCDPLDIMEAYRSFQDEFCYCADTMIRGEYPSFSTRVWKEKNVHLRISEEDKKDLKEGCADFLAFSYYLSF